MLLFIELAVGGGAGVDGQAARVADVGQVREDLQAVDEARAGGDAALDAESHNAAGAFGQVFLRSGVVGAVLQAGVSHPFDLGVRAEELCHFLSVGDVAVHTQAECFQP